VLLPAELENLIVQDGQSFAEKRPAEIRQHGHVSASINRGEARVPGDGARALEQFAAMRLETLGEAEDIAPYFGLDLEAHRHGRRARAADGFAARGQKGSGANGKPDGPYSC